MAQVLSDAVSGLRSQVIGDVVKPEHAAYDGLRKAGPLCQMGLFFWAADRGAEALRLARDSVASVPDEFGCFIAGLNAPPAPFVPEQYRHALGYALIVVGFGDAETHARAIEPARAAAPSFEFVTPIPYVALQQMFNEGNPPGVAAARCGLPSTSRRSRRPRTCWPPIGPGRAPSGTPWRRTQHQAEGRDPKLNFSCLYRLDGPQPTSQPAGRLRPAADPPVTGN